MKYLVIRDCIVSQYTEIEASSPIEAENKAHSTDTVWRHYSIIHIYPKYNASEIKQKQ